MRICRSMENYGSILFANLLFHIYQEVCECVYWPGSLVLCSMCTECLWEGDLHFGALAGFVLRSQRQGAMLFLFILGTLHHLWEAQFAN